MTKSQPERAEANLSGKYMLWIDGVGAFMLCLNNEISIGGPAQYDAPADIALLAGLSRRHATIVRDGEGYYLEAHAAVRVENRMVDWRAFLNNNQQIQLGENVALKFRLPTVLSNSAVLEFVSHHRPALSIDGVVLMEDNCLLGPGLGNHVQCPEWEESVVLYRRGDVLHCKSRGLFFIDDVPANETGVVKPGQTETSEEWRFRLEEITE